MHVATFFIGTLLNLSPMTQLYLLLWLLTFRLIVALYLVSEIQPAINKVTAAPSPILQALALYWW